jgi:hypothetical protein
MTDKSSFISSVYTKNKRWLGKSQHSVGIRLGRYDVPYDEVSFAEDNFPYLRVALLDTYLEREVV